MKYKTMSILLIISMIVIVKAEERIIGVLANRGKEHSIEKWSETAVFLTQNIATENFEILPLDFDELDSFVRDEKIDFLITNTSSYISLEEKYKIEKIATLVNEVHGLNINKFGSVIFTRMDSKIKNINDIKYKKLYAVDSTSFGGYQLAINLLINYNIYETDFLDIIFLQNHDSVVLKVLNDKNSIGTVRTDILESMAVNGLIRISDFYIINKIEDDFPFVHSTELYPEWPIARLTKVPDKVALKVSKLLIGLDEDSKPNRDASIYGWTEPLDYSSVRRCIENLKHMSAVK